MRFFADCICLFITSWFTAFLAIVLNTEWTKSDGFGHRSPGSRLFPDFFGHLTCVQYSSS
jgi:hypothetical protein